MRFVDRKINRTGLKLSDLVNQQNSDDFYKNDKVRIHLTLCYGLKCCYCEAPITSTAYFHVDHFYPQKTSTLPIQFVGKVGFNYKNIVNDIKNFHLACARCNILKSNFTGCALSPNFFHDGTSWQKSSASYISKNIWYKGALVQCSQKYWNFCNQLKLNGNTVSENRGLHSSSLLDRARYLEETRSVLEVVCNLCVRKEYEDARMLLGLISTRFLSRAPYSSMIVANLGRAFLKLKEFIKKH